MRWDSVLIVQLLRTEEAPPGNTALLVILTQFPAGFLPPLASASLALRPALSLAPVPGCLPALPRFSGHLHFYHLSDSHKSAVLMCVPGTSKDFPNS